MKDTTKISIKFQPISDNDIEFLFQVYASTRAEEMAQTDWNEQQISEFLQMQFHLQHTYYTNNYQNTSFDVILIDGNPAGRLYICHMTDEIRIMDMALLPLYRGKGIGTVILNDLIAEADKKKLPLTLHVEFNNPALRLYQRAGFQQVQENFPNIFMRRNPSK